MALALPREKDGRTAMRIYFVTWPPEQDPGTFGRLRRAGKEDVLISYFFLREGRKKIQLRSYAKKRSERRKVE